MNVPNHELMECIIHQPVSFYEYYKALAQNGGEFLNEDGTAVAFNTPDFNADAKWTINLGTLEIEGQSVTVAPLTLCHHPKKSWIGIEPLMRP